MKCLFHSAGLSVVAVMALCAQSTTTQTNPQTQNTGQTSSAPTGSSTGSQTGTSGAMGQPQTWTGVLLDASCQDVSSMRPMHSSSATSDQSSRDALSPEQRSSSSQSTTQRSERTTTGNTTTARDDRSSRSSETRSSSDATTGTRSRSSSETSSNSSQSTTSSMSSSDPYPKCRPTSTSTSFAVASNGKVYFLDEASNAKVRQQMQTDSTFMGTAGTTSPMSVVVMGNGSGPEITVTTIQRSNR